MQVPNDFDFAVWERKCNGLPPIGPLTLDQQASEDAYERYCEERQAEAEAQERAGGRTVCPQCGQRTVVHRSVLTYGVHGNPNSEYSDYAKCTACDYADL